MTEKKRGGLRSPAGGRPKKEPTETISFRVPEKHKKKLYELIKELIDNYLKQTYENNSKQNR